MCYNQQERTTRCGNVGEWPGSEARKKTNRALVLILPGAGSIQVTAAVMQDGYRIIEGLKAGLNLYLAEMGFSNAKEAVGFGLSSCTAHGRIGAGYGAVSPVPGERCIG